MYTSQQDASFILSLPSTFYQKKAKTTSSSANTPRESRKTSKPTFTAEMEFIFQEKTALRSKKQEGSHDSISRKVSPKNQRDILPGNICSPMQKNIQKHMIQSIILAAMWNVRTAQKNENLATQFIARMTLPKNKKVTSLGVHIISQF